MALSDLASWNNQDKDDKNLEALSILITQLIDELKELEERIEALE